MASQTGLLYPGWNWLLEQVPFGTPGLSPSDFFTELAVWDLSAGIKIRAFRGAFLAFDFSRYEPGRLPLQSEPFEARPSFDEQLVASQQRVAVINSFAICLHSAVLDTMQLPIESFRASQQDLLHSDDWSQGMGGPGMRHHLTNAFVNRTVDFHRHGIVTRAALDETCRRLNAVLLSSYDKTLDLTALLNTALCAFQDQDQSLALVLAWTVCEVLLDQRWRRHCTETASSSGFPLTGQRKKDFFKSLDYTASTRIETLAITGGIDATLYRRLTAARKARNAWIHNVRAVDREAAQDALMLAAEELSLASGVQLRAIGQTSVHG